MHEESCGMDVVAGAIPFDRARGEKVPGCIAILRNVLRQRQADVRVGAVLAHLSDKNKCVAKVGLPGSCWVVRGGSGSCFPTSHPPRRTRYGAPTVVLSRSVKDPLVAQAIQRCGAIGRDDSGRGRPWFRPRSGRSLCPARDGSWLCPRRRAMRIESAAGSTCAGR